MEEKIEFFAEAEKAKDNQKNISKILFILTVVMGFLVQLLLPFLTERGIATDSTIYYLYLTIIICGTIGFFGQRKLFWLWPVAYFLGQFIFFKIYSIVYHGSERSAWIGFEQLTLIISSPFYLFGSFAGNFIFRPIFNRLSQRGITGYFFAFIGLILIFFVATVFFGFLGYGRYFDYTPPEKTNEYCQGHPDYNEIKSSKVCRGYKINNACQFPGIDENVCIICSYRCLGFMIGQ